MAYQEIRHSGVGAGWRGILEKLNTDLQALGYSGDVRIKEKFGTLRIEIDAATDAVHDRVEKAEEESYRVCELCGAPGTLVEKNGWMNVRCPKCNAK